MSELQKIFDLWFSTQGDVKHLIQKWYEMEKNDPGSANNDSCEHLCDFVLTLSSSLERQAFFAGFQQAFSLCIDLMHIPEE